MSTTDALLFISFSMLLVGLCWGTLVVVAWVVKRFIPFDLGMRRCNHVALDPQAANILPWQFLGMCRFYWANRNQPGTGAQRFRQRLAQQGLLTNNFFAAVTEDGIAFQSRLLHLWHPLMPPVLIPWQSVGLSLHADHHRCVEIRLLADDGTVLLYLSPGVDSSEWHKRLITMWEKSRPGPP